jgi:hypothetical protein
VVTLESQHHLDVLESLQGTGNIWFCGAYSLRGIPLLENACDSGLNTAEKIGKAKRPWESIRMKLDGPNSVKEGGIRWAVFFFAVLITIVSALFRGLLDF